MDVESIRTADWEGERTEGGGDTDGTAMEMDD